MKLRLVLIGLLLTTATAAPMLNQINADAETPGIYIALGDSITVGIGSSLPRTRSYPELVRFRLEELHGMGVILTNLGETGETATSFLENGQLAAFREEVALAREGMIPIHAVTITLGGNELLALWNSGIADRAESLAEFEASLTEAVSQVRSEIGPDVPIVLTTYYDVTSGDPTIEFTNSWWINEFNDVIRRVAEEFEAQVAEVDETFVGQIDEYTRYPTDVHPTNQGYLAIADEVWTTLDLDSEGPRIEVLSPSVSDRLTPTMWFTVEDRVGIRKVTLQAQDGLELDPLRMSGIEYVALLDLRGSIENEVTVTITAIDDAGNTTTVEHSIFINSASEGSE